MGQTASEPFSRIVMGNIGERDTDVVSQHSYNRRPFAFMS